jgi:phage shock protein PspC (stress-responsive transcriptional regulator)
MGAAGARGHHGAMTQAAPTAPPPDTASPGTLRRPLGGRMVAGVAAGVAEYLDIDPVLVRIALVVLTLCGGAGILVYAAAWALVPEEGAPGSMAEYWASRIEEHRR